MATNVNVGMPADTAADDVHQQQLWPVVEQRLSSETEVYRSAGGSGSPYESALEAAEAALKTDSWLAATEASIVKDLKRTFPDRPDYAAREAATRNVLLAFASRSRDVGYCQSLNYVVGTLLLIPLSEAEAYFALGTLVHELMPADYYSADAHILGARVDQLAFAAVLQTQLPALARHLDAHHCPIGLVFLQWCVAPHLRNSRCLTWMWLWRRLPPRAPAAQVHVPVREGPSAARDAARVGRLLRVRRRDALRRRARDAAHGRAAPAGVREPRGAL